MTLSLANLSGGAIYPFYVAWLDVVGDPVRATTLPGGRTFAGTGDPDLDGQTFAYIPSELVTMGDVTMSATGSQTTTMTLAGVPGPNDGLLATIATRANWQGRLARRWTGLCDASGTVLEVASDLTGFIMTLELAGNPLTGQTIRATVENYLALLTAARNRTYQDQAEFDPADVSGARIRAAANGLLGTALVAAASTNLGGGSGSRSSSAAGGGGRGIGLL